MSSGPDATAKETGYLVGVARILRNWTKGGLARRAGMDKGRITHYEQGSQRPEPATMARILAAARLPGTFPQRALPWWREILAAAAPDREEPPAFAGAEGLAVRLGRIVTAVAGPLLPRLQARLRPASSPGSNPEREEERAARLVALLVSLKPPGRCVLVEGLAELRTARACRRLCDASREAAADDAEDALDLARHALRIAELAPGDEGSRAWRLGYATAILGNARRVGSDLNGADRELEEARRLRQDGPPAGDAGDPEGTAETAREAELFPEAQWLDLLASLRRAQRRWREAFALLDQACELSPPGEPRARVLLNKAFTHEQHGEPENAIATLRQALGLLTEESDPNLHFAIRFNWAVNLLHLGGHLAEAEQLHADVEERAARLGSGLHQIRVHWQAGRLDLARGRREEGIAALTEVQAAFIARNLAYDVALVTLELAVLHAEQGETRQVKALVDLAKPVFEAQRVHREALACFRLLQDAAARQAVTATLARRLLGRLREG